MRYLRLYADEFGESHFESVEIGYDQVVYAPPAPQFDISEQVKSSQFINVRFLVGWDSGLHPTPRRQLFVVCSGIIEGCSSDGVSEIFEAGDMLLMEDTSGKGHTAKVISDVDVHALMIHLD